MINKKLLKLIFVVGCVYLGVRVWILVKKKADIDKAGFYIIGKMIEVSLGFSGLVISCNDIIVGDVKDSWYILFAFSLYGLTNTIKSIIAIILDECNKK